MSCRLSGSGLSLSDAPQFQHTKARRSSSEIQSLEELARSVALANKLADELAKFDLLLQPPDELSVMDKISSLLERSKVYNDGARSNTSTLPSE